MNLKQSAEINITSIQNNIKEWLHTNPGTSGKNDNSNMYTICGDLEAAGNSLDNAQRPPEIF